MDDLEQIKTLLIEDNPGDARLIEEYLKESFFEFKPTLTLADTLEKGMSFLQEKDFDVILLDLSLPDSFGLATFDAIHKTTETVPVIVLTGLDDEKLGIEAVQAGAQDFLKKKDIDAILLGRAILYAMQRHQLTLRLEKSQQRLQQAQELAHLGNYELDLESGEITWSDETFRIFEMDPEEPAPTYEELKPIIIPEYREDIDAAIREVQERGQRGYLELGITTKSGKTKYLYSIVDPIKDKNGEVVKLFGTTQDITDRKRAELQLRENERRYRMLFQGTTDEILVFQVDDNREPLPFLDVNDIACELLGYSHEELLEKTLYDIVAAEKDEIQKRIADVIDSGKRIHESQHITKEDEVIPLEISARSFSYNGRPTIISIGRDVRDRRKLEQEILNISEQERQRIGRDMHDGLGQMLTGIGLIAQSLSNKLESQGAEGAEKVQEIADLVKEADEYARALTQGLVPVNIESNGLDSALRELTRKLSKMYDIDIQYSNTPEAKVDDNASAVHLYRIAQEAINNAIKHGNASVVHVALNMEKDHIMLHIEDNGQGFPGPEEISDGMGVRIMNFRAQMIGGHLEIKSENGEGTEVFCQMPSADDNR
ncbi:hybrid sensor histidine kinase/response regulator [Fodinibius sediminis]|uniref:histidine kinase n=1 Tax=Fodinibius sediminis TaxID=1214077 RepID=A0A521CZD2_9BACT|nr:PAS domain S-box protein [Fodinibius sediminis]SMO64784.1 PAS domain S-box-containing protein [Fodinibius sediminis]